jgi:L-ribulose-5-phosphate 3-epimerase
VSYSVGVNRRHFVGLATSALGAAALPRALASAPAPIKPFALGVVVKPNPDPEVPFRMLHQLGFPTVFLSMDDYLGKFTPQLATQFRGLFQKYELTPTTIEVVGPPPLAWNFMQGPTTIGLVPPATREVRIDALRQASDFAKLLGISQVQTHCGFIPENPGDPLYAQAVLAIRKVAEHCKGNNQQFLMETGQETPTTMSRAIRDVSMPNLGVGLDTANLLLYGKANPVDAIDILGPHIKSVHAKDGHWPTDPYKFGEEVVIGTGIVDFKTVFMKLNKLGYKGAVTIEREISGPKQEADIRIAKAYLDRVLKEVTA